MRYIVCSSNDIQKLVRIASLPTAQTQSKGRKREREREKEEEGKREKKKGNKNNQIIKVRHLLDASQFACYKPLVP